MPTIEYVTVANHAENVNGLLYLMGAGWTDLNPQVSPDGQLVANFGIGLSLLVGWNDTNQRYTVEVTLTHEDGGAPLVQFGGEFETGRPAGLPPGSDLRTVLAANLNVAFPRPGGYVVTASLPGETKSVAFRVNGPPPAPGPVSPTSY